VLNTGAVNSTIQIGAINAPLAYIAERLTGDGVTVSLLAPAGEDPAEWVPRAEDVLEMQKMDLILLNGAGYEPWLDRVSLPAEKLLNTSGGMSEELISTESVTHQHGPEGSHSHAARAFTIWLDPLLAIRQARAVNAAVAAMAGHPGSASGEKLAALEADLMQLHEDWQAAVVQIQGERVLFSHPVYQYFERRYVIEGDSLHWEPDTEPDASQWADLEARIGEHLSRIMIWEQAPLEATKAKLAELGFAVVVIDPAAGVGSTADFLAIQRANVAALRAVTSSTIR
jgi:zinc transport system substrate-binding protein